MNLPLFHLNNLNRDFGILPGGRGFDHGTHGFRDTTLTPDDLTHIILGNMKFEHGLPIFLSFVHTDGLGMFH